MRRTPAQIEASRRNGSKSRGPITPEGKAISSRNSLRHGCTAKSIVLRNENAQEFIDLNAVYEKKFQPADDVERDFVDEMAVARWRLRRDWINETALFDSEMSRQANEVAERYTTIDQPCIFARAFKSLADESHSLVNAARYETNHRRAYYRALAGFIQLRSAFPPVPDAVAPDRKPPEPLPAPAPNPAGEPNQQNCETNPSPANSPAPTGNPTAHPAPQPPTSNLSAPDSAPPTEFNPKKSIM